MKKETTPQGCVKDLQRRFVQFEADGELFGFLLNDVPLWWFVRQQVFAQLARQRTGLDLFSHWGTGGLSLPERARKVAQALLRRSNSVGGHSGGVVALSTASARRHKTPDGRDFDVFFDFLSYVPEQDYTVVEFPDRTPHSSNPYSERVIYGDWLSLLGNLGRSLGTVRESPSLTEFHQTIATTARKHHLPVSSEWVRLAVLKEAGFVLFTMKVADKLLDSLNPEVLLVECGYAPSHMVVQYCARRRGIPVVELQHGLIGQRDVAYSFGLGKEGDLRNSPFPDVICVFGEHFRRVLKGNVHLSEEVIRVVGYPHLWLQYNELLRFASPSKKRQSILITSQPGLGTFWGDFAVELKGRLQWPVTIRPHPAESGCISGIFGKALACSGITVLTDDRPLYAAFLEATHHISISSTSHLEAIVFGLKDLVVAYAQAQEELDFLLAMGLPLVRTVDEAVKVILSYPDIGAVRDHVMREVLALDRDPIEAVKDLLDTIRTQRWTKRG